MSWTTRFRLLFAALFTVAALTTIVGWLFGKDPTQMGGVLMWCAAACGVGEASNVGKRATWDKEAVEYGDPAGAPWLHERGDRGRPVY